MKYKGVGWKAFSISVVVVGAFMFMIGYYVKGYDDVKLVPTPPASDWDPIAEAIYTAGVKEVNDSKVYDENGNLDITASSKNLKVLIEKNFKEIEKEMKSDKALWIPTDMQSYMINNFAESIRFHVCREAVYNNSGKFVKSEYYINFVAKYNEVEISLFRRMDLDQARGTYRFCKSLRTESRDIGAMITCGEFPNEIK